MLVEESCIASVLPAKIIQSLLPLETPMEYAYGAVLLCLQSFIMMCCGRKPGPALQTKPLRFGPRLVKYEKNEMGDPDFAEKMDRPQGMVTVSDADLCGAVLRCLQSFITMRCGRKPGPA